MENQMNESNKLLTNKEVRTLIQQSQDGNIHARDTLVERNIRLVWSVVQRFMNRGYDSEDLFQIGSIGLMKSIDKFDLSYDVKFSTYAVPMILGEIQRFIRDDGTIKVSRSLKEVSHKVRRSKEELSKRLGRSPTISELSATLDISKEDIIQAEEAIRSPQSIYETVYENDGDPIELIDQIAEEETNWFDQIILKEAISTLPQRDKMIIYLRYFQDCTQSQVAKRLGVSQVQISRLEKKILQSMKLRLNVHSDS